MSLGYGGSLTCEKDSEFRCKVCKARCTRSPVDATEYGHLVGCPQRPEKFHVGSGDGRRYRPEEDLEGGVSA